MAPRWPEKLDLEIFPADRRSVAPPRRLAARCRGPGGPVASVTFRGRRPASPKAGVPPASPHPPEDRGLAGLVVLFRPFRPIVTRGPRETAVDTGVECFVFAEEAAQSTVARTPGVGEPF